MISNQFPQLKNLPIQAIDKPGWDHWTFRLGEAMVIRLPSAARYAPQVIKEHEWLWQIAPHLSVGIPKPFALGSPTAGFPWHWSIRYWIEGETADCGEITSLDDFAGSLVTFLGELQRIELSGGPNAGVENFYRGAQLQRYDSETRTLAEKLKHLVDKQGILKLWDKAQDLSWGLKPVWVHGDMSANNLIVREGKLKSIIDFGLMAIGDPACDLVIAWTFFTGSSRECFRSGVDLDKDTWIRARAWCLWKALLTLDSQKEQNLSIEQTLGLVQTILSDHREYS